MSEPKQPEPDTPQPPGDDAIPKPPSPEDLKKISEQQKLLTDEWTGDGAEEK